MPKKMTLRNFYKEKLQMAYKYMNRCWTSLVVREMQIKPTVSYQFTPTNMAVKQCSHYSKEAADLQKI